MCSGSKTCGKRTTFDKGNKGMSRGSGTTAQSSIRAAPRVAASGPVLHLTACGDVITSRASATEPVAKEAGHGCDEPVRIAVSLDPHRGGHHLDRSSLFLQLG